MLQKFQFLYTIPGNPIKDINDTNPFSTTLPGPFDPYHAINWFKAIGGNQSGAVTIGYFAVVRLSEDQRDWITKLTNHKKDGKSVLVWCKVSKEVKRAMDDKKTIDHLYDGFGVKIEK